MKAEFEELDPPAHDKHPRTHTHQHESKPRNYDDAHVGTKQTPVSGFVEADARRIYIHKRKQADAHTHTDEPTHRKHTVQEKPRAARVQPSAYLLHTHRFN